LSDLDIGFNRWRHRQHIYCTSDSPVAFAFDSEPGTIIVRIITWNVNRRVKQLEAQVEMLQAHEPDIVALQEVTATTLPLMRKALANIGLMHSRDNLARDVSRRNVLLVASRWEVENVVTAIPALEQTAAVLPAKIQTPHGQLFVHNTHVPTAANGLVNKLTLMDALCDVLEAPTDCPRILCGDFNLPQKETLAGELITFGQRLRKSGAWGVVNAETDRIERRIMTGLAAFDLPDIYRLLNGYTAQEFSWYAKNRGRMFGFRLDHIFASRSLKPVECRYLHPARETNLSDHSPLMAAFDMPSS
jgi:exonuclease III